MHSEASELAAKAAAKSTGVPWFKGDQVKRLSCQNQSSCVIKMAPKTSLVALGNGEAKPFHGRGSLCLAEADPLAGVLSSPVGSSRLGESCCEQGQQATATAKGVGSLGSRQEETASPQKSFRARPSLLPSGWAVPLPLASPLIYLYQTLCCHLHRKCAPQGSLLSGLDAVHLSETLWAGSTQAFFLLFIQ